jgi:hypothetical protein
MTPRLDAAALYVITLPPKQSGKIRKFAQCEQLFRLSANGRIPKLDIHPISSEHNLVNL